jgi:hypothetical protein
LLAGKRGCSRPGASIIWPLNSNTLRGTLVEFPMLTFNNLKRCLPNSFGNCRSIATQS